MESMNKIYQNQIEASNKDRKISIAEGVILTIPATADYVRIKKIPYKKIDISYHRYKKIVGGDEFGLGHEEVSSSLTGVIIEELKKLEVKNENA